MKALLGVCVIGFIVIAVFTLSKKDQDITDLDQGDNEEVQVEKVAAPEPKAEETQEVASKEPEQPKVADAPPPPPAKAKDPAAWVKEYKTTNFSAKQGDRFIIDKKGQPLSRVPSSLKVEVKPADDWQEKLMAQLNQEATFSEKGDTKITKGDKKFLMVDGDTGIPAEMAHIKFTAPDGAKGSFSAYVNSGTGEILMAFNGLRNGQAFVPPTE
ncbi:hypothetical protein OAK75_08710 [Bacteriovoracales bacterium]|nr:hypothetical protein [Bacteriovoracales bacterium]